MELERLTPRGDGQPVRILDADAHALPLGDAAFERVFPGGGIAGYRNPARALAEMARVAVPGMPSLRASADNALDPAPVSHTC